MKAIKVKFMYLEKKTDKNSLNTISIGCGE